METHKLAPADLGYRPVIVATYNRRLTNYLVHVSGAQAVAHPLPAAMADFHVGDGYSIVTLPMGAPATILALEFMIAAGTKALITVGTCGGLQPDLPVGSCILPEEVVREEGTSHHYAAADVPARPSSRLLASIERHCRDQDLEPTRGLAWTTDAPYREHKEKIARYREAGVLAVDMEASAVFTVAACRSVAAAAIFVVSDELFEPYRLGFSSPELLDGMARAGRAALAAAAELAGEAAAEAPSEEL
ncbi:MAG: nucleoside phosphorylase [Dehalococcoidia bacterium]